MAHTSFLKENNENAKYANMKIALQENSLSSNAADEDSNIFYEAPNYLENVDGYMVNDFETSNYGYGQDLYRKVKLLKAKQEATNPSHFRPSRKSIAVRRRWRIEKFSDSSCLKTRGDNFARFNKNCNRCSDEDSGSDDADNEIKSIQKLILSKGSQNSETPKNVRDAGNYRDSIFYWRPTVKEMVHAIQEQCSVSTMPPKLANKSKLSPPMPLPRKQNQPPASPNPSPSREIRQDITSIPNNDELQYTATISAADQKCKSREKHMEIPDRTGRALLQMVPNITIQITPPKEDVDPVYGSSDLCSTTVKNNESGIGGTGKNTSDTRTNGNETVNDISGIFHDDAAKSRIAVQSHTSKDQSPQQQHSKTKRLNYVQRASYLIKKMRPSSLGRCKAVSKINELVEFGKTAMKHVIKSWSVSDATDDTVAFCNDECLIPIAESLDSETTDATEEGTAPIVYTQSDTAISNDTPGDSHPPIYCLRVVQPTGRQIRQCNASRMFGSSVQRLNSDSSEELDEFFVYGCERQKDNSKSKKNYFLMKQHDQELQSKIKHYIDSKGKSDNKIQWWAEDFRIDRNEDIPFDSAMSLHASKSPVLASIEESASETENEIEAVNLIEKGKSFTTQKAAHDKNVKQDLKKCQNLACSSCSNCIGETNSEQDSIPHCQEDLSLSVPLKTQSLVNATDVGHSESGMTDVMAIVSQEVSIRRYPSFPDLTDIIDDQNPLAGDKESVMALQNVPELDKDVLEMNLETSFEPDDPSVNIEESNVPNDTTAQTLQAEDVDGNGPLKLTQPQNSPEVKKEGLSRPVGTIVSLLESCTVLRKDSPVFMVRSDCYKTFSTPTASNIPRGDVTMSIHKTSPKSVSCSDFRSSQKLENNVTESFKPIDTMVTPPDENEITEMNLPSPPSGSFQNSDSMVSDKERNPDQIMATSTKSDSEKNLIASDDAYQKMNNSNETSTLEMSSDAMLIVNCLSTQITNSMEKRHLIEDSTEEDTANDSNKKCDTQSCADVSGEFQVEISQGSVKHDLSSTAEVGNTADFVQVQMNTPAAVGNIVVYEPKKVVIDVAEDQFCVKIDVINKRKEMGKETSGIVESDTKGRLDQISVNDAPEQNKNTEEAIILDDDVCTSTNITDAFKAGRDIKETVCTVADGSAKHDNAVDDSKEDYKGPADGVSLHEEQGAKSNDMNILENLNEDRTYTDSQDEKEKNIISCSEEFYENKCESETASLQEEVFVNENVTCDSQEINKDETEIGLTEEEVFPELNSVMELYRGIAKTTSLEKEMSTFLDGTSISEKIEEDIAEGTASKSAQVKINNGSNELDINEDFLEREVCARQKAISTSKDNGKDVEATASLQEEKYTEQKIISDDEEVQENTAIVSLYEETTSRNTKVIQYAEEGAEKIDFTEAEESQQGEPVHLGISSEAHENHVKRYTSMAESEGERESDNLKAICNFTEASRGEVKNTCTEEDAFQNQNIVSYSKETETKRDKINSAILVDENLGVQNILSDSTEMNKVVAETTSLEEENGSKSNIMSDSRGIYKCSLQEEECTKSTPSDADISRSGERTNDTIQEKGSNEKILSSDVEDFSEDTQLEAQSQMDPKEEPTSSKTKFNSTHRESSFHCTEMNRNTIGATCRVRKPAVPQPKLNISGPFKLENVAEERQYSSSEDSVESDNFPPKQIKWNCPQSERSSSGDSAGEENPVSPQDSQTSGDSGMGNSTQNNDNLFLEKQETTNENDQMKQPEGEKTTVGQNSEMKDFRDHSNLQKSCYSHNENYAGFDDFKIIQCVPMDGRAIDFSHFKKGGEIQAFNYIHDLHDLSDSQEYTFDAGQALEDQQHQNLNQSATRKQHPFFNSDDSRNKQHTTHDQMQRLSAEGDTSVSETNINGQENFPEYRSGHSSCLFTFSEACRHSNVCRNVKAPSMSSPLPPYSFFKNLVARNSLGRIERGLRDTEERLNKAFDFVSRSQRHLDRCDEIIVKSSEIIQTSQEMIAKCQKQMKETAWTMENGRKTNSSQ